MRLRLSHRDDRRRRKHEDENGWCERDSEHVEQLSLSSDYIQATRKLLWYEGYDHRVGPRLKRVTIHVMFSTSFSTDVRSGSRRANGHALSSLFHC